MGGATVWAGPAGGSGHGVGGACGAGSSHGGGGACGAGLRTLGLLLSLPPSPCPAGLIKDKFFSSEDN